MHLFYSATFFFYFLLVFAGFFLSCLGIVRGKRGRRGGQGEDGWSIKFDNVHVQLRIILKLPVNLNITLFYLYGGLEARAKPQAS